MKIDLSYDELKILCECVRDCDFIDTIEMSLLEKLQRAREINTVLHHIDHNIISETTGSQQMFHGSTNYENMGNEG